MSLTIERVIKEVKHMSIMISLKNTILEKVLEALKDSGFPVYQFVPVGVRAPLACVSFLKEEWRNDLPSPFFQATVTLKIEILSEVQGLQEVYAMIEKIFFKLDGSKFTHNSSQFWVKHTSTEVQNQQSSHIHGLRRGVVLFQIRWRT